MTQYLSICKRKTNFIFDDNDFLNIFNLLRLTRDFNRDDEISIDISNLDQKQQHTIASKFTIFLALYFEIIKPSKSSFAHLVYSKISQECIDNLGSSQDFIQENNTLIFDASGSYKKIKKHQDPHYIKNARGVALLSLVQDLLAYGSIPNTLLTFEENSPILLHSASIFLYNTDNSKMLWSILEELDSQYKNRYKTILTSRFSRSLDARKGLECSFAEATANPLINITKNHFVKSLQAKLNLPTNIYEPTGKLSLWLIDDQHANGWFKLISSVASKKYIEITSLINKEDVSLQIELIKSSDELYAPDIAIVDLRLSQNDGRNEEYNAKDLSGFEVVDLLKNRWSSLSIMIASASNKLWNMEKAIKKGAVAYWRKSDEISENSYQDAIFTAFDIYIQLIEKFTTSIKRTRYRYIFKIVELIKNEVSSLDDNYNLLKKIIANYSDNLEQKISWTCWYKSSEEKTNDSIHLEISEIFNELENHLWNPKSQNLTLFPEKKVQLGNKNSDKLIINDTLNCLDLKYGITGQALKEHYEKYKAIRNKLPIIHGSETAQDVKHASLTDIETALLIIWCLLRELKPKFN